MTLKELEGREPDKVTTSIYGRRVEIYGVPSHETMVEVMYPLIKTRLEAEAREKVAAERRKTKEERKRKLE